jgi:2,5-dihydroxypyridine 5,6-dioxygenase
MLQELVEPAWLDAFESVLRRCALQPGDTVAILAESQSRPVLVDLARLASARLGHSRSPCCCPVCLNQNSL